MVASEVSFAMNILSNCISCVDLPPKVTTSMEPTTLTMNVTKCPETQVFLCSSEDIPGVCLETETFEQMKDAIRTVVPGLISHNLKIDERDLQDVVLQVFRTEEVALQSTPGTKGQLSRPRLLIEEPSNRAIA